MKTSALCMLLFIQLAFSQKIFCQNVSINSTGNPADASAMLDVSSTTGGFLMPRLTSVQRDAISSPAVGLTLFNTTLVAYQVNTGTPSVPVWSTLTTATTTNAWSLGGNSVASVQNIGTITNFDFPFITNNTERMRLSAGGNLGIGATVTDGANAEKLLVDAGTNSFNVISGRGDNPGYLQLNIKNINSGTSASSDVVATNDAGTEANGLNFVDMGINSSTYNVGAFNITGPSDAYLYTTGNDFAIGNATATKSLKFFTGGTVAGSERMRINGSGYVGIGVTTPTAILHLKAGTTAANTAPLKFTSGALMTTAEAGAVEFLTDKYYGTIGTGAARKEFTLNNITLTAGRVPFATTLGRLTDLPAFTYTTNRLFPTYITLAAGTATAATAPLVFTAGVNLTAPTAGALEFDGTHYYGTVASTRYQLDQQAGTIYTGSNGITLVGNDFRNNLITGLAGGQTIIGGTAASNSLTLSSTSNATKGNIILGGSAYDEANNRLGLGNTAPTEKLDVTGNVRFSGALMPNNAAGTAGSYLTSNGAGAAPTWSTNLSGTNTGDVTLGTANGLSLTGQALSLGLASTSTTGALSATDWNTFNTKGTGSVSSVSVTTANGVSGSVANATTTPAISLTLGAITPTSVAASGSVTGSNLSGTNTGNQTIALTGDVTGTGTGSFAATIANNAVTYGKIQAVSATSKLLGSSSTTTPVQELTIGSGLNLSGTTLTAAGSGGTVTSASVVSANGLAGTVANAATTPAITLSTTVTGIVKGNGTALSPATAGTDYSPGTAGNATGILKSTTGTGALTTAVAGDFPLLNQNTTGNAATVTTNANLTGDVTSSGNATTIGANKVTLANMAQVANGTFLGRITAGTGNVEALSTAQAKTLLGSDGTNTGDVTLGTANGLSLTGQALSLGLASTSTTGALSATDWNTFNTKAGTASVWSLSGNAGTSASTNFLGTTDNQDMVFKANNVEKLRLINSTSQLQIGNADSGVIKSTKEFVLRQDGDQYGPSVFRLRNRNGENGAIFETIDAGAYLVDFIFRTGPVATPITSNIRFETRTGSSTKVTGNATEWQFGQPDNVYGGPTLVIGASGTGSNSSLLIGNFGIGNANPAQKLDVTGNVGFSGALMPGNLAGTAGSYLTSNGAGAAPTWSTNLSGTNTGDVTLGTANGLSLTGQALSLGLASTSTTGALSATDWNTFNTKGTGSVSSVSVTTANGVSGSVANATTTPAISLTLGAITPTSVAASGSVTGSNLSGTNTGNQTIALTGDVTGTGTGSFAATIANNAVTYGKIQAVSATSKLLGSSSTTTPVQELTIGSGLNLSGTTLTAAGSGGTVTSASVVSANGLAGTVANAATTPAITLSTTVTGIVKGNGTALSPATAGTDYSPGTSANTTGIVKSTSGTGALTTAVAGDFPILNQSTTGNAATVTTNANLTGDVTSSGNATTIGANKVTLANMAQVANGTFLGRITAGTGNVEALSTAQAKTLLGSGGTNTGDVTIGTANGLSLTGQALSLGLASTSTTGALSSTDWNTFNTKASAAGTWSTTGNTGTASITNFIGTTDNKSFKIRTNNTQTFLADSLGNVAIGAAPTFSALPEREKFLVDAGVTTSINAIAARGSINSYLQFNIQNLSAGANATTDIVATANNGSESGNYVDLGINGSNYSGGAIQTGVANDGYLISAGNDFYMVNSSPNKSMLFLTGGTGVSNERMRILANGRVGMGVQDPNAPFVVKDTMEIRRVGSLSQLLFTNTSGSGDFRIGGDGGDLYWQGGGSRALQMGSYWTTILGGDRQGVGGAYPGFVNGVGGTGVLVQSQRDASIPLAIQSFSATQAANITEWRNSSGTVLNAVTKDGNLGLGLSNPTAKLHVIGTNPLTLIGVQTGTGSDSLLTIVNGIVKKVAPSTLPVANAWALTGNSTTNPSANFLGTTDNQPVVFKVNNQQIGRVEQTSFAWGAGAGTNTATNSMALGNGTSLGSGISNAMAIGNFANATISNTFAIGHNAISNPTNGDNSFAIGNSATVNSTGSFVVGPSATTAVSISNAFAIGKSAVVNGTNALAIGNTATVGTGATGAIAIGNGALANATGSISLGAATVGASSTNSMALGNGASIGSALTSSSAIGPNASTTFSNTMILGDLSNTALSVGIGSEAFSSSTREKLLVDAGTVATDGYVSVIGGKGNTNNYMQINMQNRSNGSIASTDIVATNDAGTELNQLYFVDMGINSSGNTSTGMLGGNHTAYLYSTGNDFSIGNSISGKPLRLFTGGLADANERMRIDGNGNVGIKTTTPNSTFHNAGSFSLGITTQTATYTATENDYTIVCSNGAAMTVNLPTAIGIAGRIYVIKKMSGGSLNVIVDPNGSQTVDGAATKVLTVQYEKVTIQSDNANWIILSN